jgi:predicted N-acyltransferase
VRAALEDPARLEAEVARRAQAMQEMQEMQESDTHSESCATAVQLSKLRQGPGRFINCFTEGLSGKEEFEPSRARLRQRIAALEQHAQRKAAEAADTHDLQLLVGRLDEFAAKARAGLVGADWRLRREIIRALVRQIEVTTEQITLVFRIGPQPRGPGPPLDHVPHCLPQLSLHPPQTGRRAARRARTPIHRPAALPSLGLDSPRFFLRWRTVDSISSTKVRLPNYSAPISYIVTPCSCYSLGDTSGKELVEVEQSTARSGGDGEELTGCVLRETGAMEGYAYRLDATVDAVDGDAWDALCASADAEVMMTRRFLRVVEKQQMFGSRQRYAMLTDLVAGEPIAAAVFTLLPLDVTGLAGQTVRQTVAMIRHIMPHFLRFTLALCGLPVSLGQRSLIIRAGADGARTVAALDTLLRHVAMQARTPLMGYGEFALQDMAQLETLEGRGYHRVQNLPLHTFPPRFRDFEEYVRAIRAPYRYGIRQSQKKLRHAGVTIDRLEDPEQIASWYTEEVHQLYLAVVARAQYQFEVLTATFFRDLARAFPGELTVAAAHTASGQVIGFLYSLLSQARFHSLYIGMDYGWNTACDLYFNLMYADLDYALRHGAQRIDLSQTADTFKVRLGCQQEPRYFCVRAQGRAPSIALRCVLPLLAPSLAPVPAFRVFSS